MLPLEILLPQSRHKEIKGLSDEEKKTFYQKEVGEITSYDKKAIEHLLEISSNDPNLKIKSWEHGIRNLVFQSKTLEEVQSALKKTNNSMARRLLNKQIHSFVLFSLSFLENVLINLKKKSPIDLYEIMICGGSPISKDWDVKTLFDNKNSIQELYECQGEERYKENARLFFNFCGIKSGCDFDILREKVVNGFQNKQICRHKGVVCAKINIDV